MRVQNLTKAEQNRLKAWAIVCDNKVILETVRRTRRECISTFMQDRDLDAVKWSDRYSDRQRWKARQIEINILALL
jgi:hypothetical protein